MRKGDLSPLLHSRIVCSGSTLQVTSQLVAIDCRSVRQELTNYTEGDLTPALRAKIDEHLQGCPDCRAMYDGTRNVIVLLGGKDILQLPQGFSQRLRNRLLAQTR